jgi:hypothetical protein
MHLIVDVVTWYAKRSVEKRSDGEGRMTALTGTEVAQDMARILIEQ